MFAIEIQKLIKTYKTGTQALKGVDLRIEQGDFFALLGSNGAGKTTLIGILTGLVTKTGGTVNVFGHDIDKDFSAAKRLMGIVPQEFNFHMFEKVQDIVVNQGGFFGLETKEAKENAQEILQRVGLWERRNAMARTLSGGMKRRLMIARALVHKPKILILDEPTAGVDVELRHGMWDYLRDINAQGVTILLTTHYLEEVCQMCRKAAIIKDGSIVYQDTVRNLMALVKDEVYVISVQDTIPMTLLNAYGAKEVDAHTA